MKEKKAKLKLEDIKVESFITTLDENQTKRVGGASDVVTCDKPETLYPPVCTAVQCHTAPPYCQD
jgi:hypothetical protein